ncbi:MAG: PTS sugar transporter subunit IIA [Lentisphaeria bacterium]|nr:PTS sugar transporter subunit IIA [Lentisphaeria bacterium]
MILTLRELADHLRVNERTIMRMLKTGQVKGTKIGGQWRFNGSQVHNLFFPDSSPVEDAVPLDSLLHPSLGLPLSRVISEDRMVLDLQGRTAEEIIVELTSSTMLNKVLMNAGELRDKCLAREKLLSTGVGGGVAIPHPRDPLTTLRAPAIVIFGRSREGVDFGAVDGAPARLFFLLCCQNIELHLHLMGRLAQTLRTEGFADACLSAESATDVLRLVMKVERATFLV